MSQHVIPLDGGTVSLPAVLELAHPSTGTVLFAHGSGSSRVSPRNRSVAAALRAAGYSTLLFDLLTPGEAEDRANVFDIPLLASRVVEAVDWASGREELSGFPIGLFGASTGAAAALAAAAVRPDTVAAVVSRGGRPDMAMDRLPDVVCPTLLIVGGADTEVLALNRAAYAALRCAKKLHVVRGATHLFEEPGALEEVVRETVRWFGAAFAPA